MKLFVVETYVDDKWGPKYLHKGLFRSILQEAQTRLGCVRVRRIKTLAEQDQYNNKVWFEVDVEDVGTKIEWVV